MKISEVVKMLNKIKKGHGDIDVYVPDSSEYHYEPASKIELRTELNMANGQIDKSVIIDF